MTSGSNEIIKPSAVDISGSVIVIEWDDGHRGVYPHRMLRLRCPCAACVEEMTGRALLDPASVPAEVRALDQMAVGQYALQFLWSDAHYTGIYTYRALRAACTCIACNEARARAAAQG